MRRSRAIAKAQQQADLRPVALTFLFVVAALFIAAL